MVPRPVIPRHVGFIPNIVYFKPAGVPLRQLQVVKLSLPELEAMRLKDGAGLDQTECARLMRVSRPTFQRTLISARQKVADALVNGKAIQVETNVPSEIENEESVNPEIHNTINGFCPACDPKGRGSHSNMRCKS